MSYGYSLRLVELNQKACDLYDPTPVGVLLGKRCIDRGVPVTRVAEHLGVSRQTVYNWFIGAHFASPTHESMLEAFLKKLDK